MLILPHGISKNEKHLCTYLKSNSDSRPGVVFSITGLSNTPPPLPPPVADKAMRIPRVMHGPLQGECFSPFKRKITPLLEGINNHASNAIKRLVIDNEK